MIERRKIPEINIDAAVAQMLRNEGNDSLAQGLYRVSKEAEHILRRPSRRDESVYLCEWWKEDRKDNQK